MKILEIGKPGEAPFSKEGCFLRKDKKLIMCIEGTKDASIKQTNKQKLSRLIKDKLVLSKNYNQNIKKGIPLS